MQSRLQVVQTDPNFSWFGVAHQVDVAGVEIGNYFTLGTGEACTIDIPFVGNGPIQDLCPGGNLVDPEGRYVFTKDRQGLPNTIAGQASIEREKPEPQLMEKHAFGYRTVGDFR